MRYESRTIDNMHKILKRLAIKERVNKKEIIACFHDAVTHKENYGTWIREEVNTKICLRTFSIIMISYTNQIAAFRFVVPLK